MAIGLITKAEGGAAVGPLFVDRISFAADGAYPTGGTAAMLAAIQAKIGAGRDILAVIPQDCGGYMVTYDHTADKLKVYWCAGAGAVPVEVTNTTNLSAVTFNLTIISK